jgi:CRP/FNR family transcriptional regulator, cyclic AMP receptor protein
MKMELKEAFCLLDKFHTIEQSTLLSLCISSYTKTLKKGTQLFYDKENVTVLYIIVSGVASIYKYNSQDEKKVIFVLGKGDFLNEEILHELPISSNCEILEEAELICIPKCEILKLMKIDFELTKIIVNSLSLKVRRMYRQLKNTSNSVNLNKQLSAKLWKLSEDYGVSCEEGTSVNIRLTITYLADMLGSKRETVSKQLKILTEKNLVIVKNNTFIIPNRDLLAKHFKSP